MKPGNTTKDDGASAPSETAIVATIANNGDRVRQAPSRMAMTATIVKNGGRISYPGGKGQLYQKIINLIPPHRVYIEPFAGGATILRRKLPAPGNIAIDADAGALNQLRSVIAKNGGMDQLRFINSDALVWLSEYKFRGDEFIYADPPYLMSTRRQHRRLYRCELATAEEHAALLDILVQIPCKIMLSGYMSSLYADRLNDWYTKAFSVRTRGGSLATEWLWMNYPEPTALHDYRYLGNDYRERERIKRKVKRWRSKLATLDRLERQAILSALLKAV